MRLEIKLKAFEANLIDEATKKIVEVAKQLGVAISGPVPLPTRREIFTVLRSVHVNKTSREQFESRTHKRLIVLGNVEAQHVETLKRFDLPAGVQVSVKSVE